MKKGKKKIFFNKIKKCVIEKPYVDFIKFAGVPTEVHMLANTHLLIINKMQTKIKIFS